MFTTSSRFWVIEKRKLGTYRRLGTPDWYRLQVFLEDGTDKLYQKVGKPPTNGAKQTRRAKTSSTHRRKPEISCGTFTLTLLTLLSV